MEPIIVIPVLLIVVATFYNYILPIIIKRRKFYAIEKLGGPVWVPLLGTTATLLGLKRSEVLPEFRRQIKMYGPIYRTWNVMQPVVNLTKAEQAETILRKPLSKGPVVYKFLKPYLGDGLVTADGPKWRQHRKLLTPTFHFQNLENAQPIFTDNGQKLANYLSDKANGKLFDMWDDIGMCILDVVTESSMGIKVNALERRDSNFVASIQGFGKIATGRILKAYQHIDFIFKRTATGKLQQKYLDYLLEFNNKIINDRREQRKNMKRKIINEEDILQGKRPQYIFLDLMLDQMELHNSPLSDSDLRDEMNTFMGAAYDTTTATINWTILAIAGDPELQARVHAELDAVFHGEERPITSEDLNELDLLERVIKETLRYVTMAVIVARQLDADTEIDGHIIPAGVMVLVHIHHIHRDPQYWTNPEAFDPDRFLPENSVNRHPYAYLPFSAGPRNCLGRNFSSRNAKTILAHIFRKYNVKGAKKIVDITPLLGIITYPEGGTRVSLEPRTTFS